MARVYKIVVFFSCRQRGWSETYYLDADQVLPDPSTQNPANAASFAAVSGFIKTTLMPKRMALAGKEVEAFAIRVSSVSSPGKSFLDYKDIPVSNQQQSADNPPSDLVCTQYVADFGDKRQIHMRGIWDVIDDSGGKLVTTPAWDAAFAGYAGVLTSPGWGWMGGSVTHLADLLSYTPDVDTEQITFAFRPALEPPGGTMFPAGVVGKVVSINLSGINGGSTLNGQQTVRVLTTSTCISTGRISAFPYSFGGRGRYNEKAFLRVSSVVGTKIGSRDTGAPLLQPVGRHKKRARG